MGIAWMALKPQVFRQGVAVDDRGRDAQRNAVAGRGNPGPPRLAHIVSGSDIAHDLEGACGFLDLLGEVDLLLQVVGADLRAVLFGEEEPNVVGQPVDQPMLLGGGAVEEIDQAPAEIFDVAFDRRVRHRREEVAPDGGDGLLEGLDRRWRHARQFFGGRFEMAQFQCRQGGC